MRAANNNFHRADMRTALALAAAVSMLVLAAGDAGAAGIADTRHNLSSSNAITDANKTDEGEICVFCHTPHGSSATAAAPLWNKKLAAATSYTAYSSTTLDGTIDLANSVSLACLTCHDGTQAMETVLNKPGSGGYDADGNTGWVTWTSSTGNTVDETTGKLLSTAVANLGTDLSNDHPVGIQYAKSSVGTLDSDFVNAAKHATLDRWWVDTSTGTSGTRDKTDMVLYTKSDNKPYVECASCHDPHTTNDTFLRIANTGSAVCLACHVK